MAYTDAPEVEEFANVLIDNLCEFEHLRDKPIAYQFTDKKMMMNGQPLAGKAMKAPSPWKGDGLADFKIVIYGPTWNAYNTEERQALIHHELMHLDYTEVTKKGETFQVPSIRPHDVQEFTKTRQRFGDYRYDLRVFFESPRESVRDVLCMEEEA